MLLQETTTTTIRHARIRGIRRWIPGLTLLERFDRKVFFQDIVAGIILTALLAPAGIGYAEAAGLPPIYGLYASLMPLLAYALFGPSRILIMGPDSAVIVLIGATVLPLAAGDGIRAAALAALLAIISGSFCVFAGMARLGFVTDLLSKPIRLGYMNGIALTLMVAQFPKIFGFPIKGGNFLASSQQLAQGVFGGHINWTACVLGVSCIAIIQAFRRWAPRMPGILIAMVFATFSVSFFDLSQRAHIAIVGALPQGLPGIQISAITYSELTSLCVGAVAITLISMAQMSVLSRIYAQRGGYFVDENQELVALGMSNMITGLFQGFSISCSASRTPVAESAGAKTQMTGVVAAICIALLLVLAPGLMTNLPTAALGAVIICACSSMFEVVNVWRLFTLRRGEYILSLICFLGVISLGVINGVFIAIGVALLSFIWRAWRPYCAVLGRVDGMKGYHDITRYPHARLIPGLVLFRWDAPLFFANAEMFREQTLKAVSSAESPVRWVVVSAEPVTDIDLTAADVLLDLEKELAKVGIQLCFAQMKDPVKDHLKKYGLYEKFGDDNFHPTVGKAVDRYLGKHDIEWVDWADRRRVSAA